MSYDLEARGDDKYSALLDRKGVHEVIAALPDVRAEGHAQFVLERDDGTYMEINSERVSEEGDFIEDPHAPAHEVNCVRFHIPYAYMEKADDCVAVAETIAAKLGWELIDLQRWGEPVTPRSLADSLGIFGKVLSFLGVALAGVLVCAEGIVQLATGKGMLLPHSRWLGALSMTVGIVAMFLGLRAAIVAARNAMSVKA